MIELAQLFQDVEAAVVQQEPAVEEIETKAGVISDNVGKANNEIDGAIAKTRSRNRKKWIVLWIIGMYISKYYTMRLWWLLTIPSCHHPHRRAHWGPCEQALEKVVPMDVYFGGRLSTRHICHHYSHVLVILCPLAPATEFIRGFEKRLVPQLTSSIRLNLAVVERGDGVPLDPFFFSLMCILVFVYHCGEK